MPEPAKAKAAWVREADTLDAFGPALHAMVRRALAAAERIERLSGSKHTLYLDSPVIDAINADAGRLSERFTDLASEYRFAQFMH